MEGENNFLDKFKEKLVVIVYREENQEKNSKAIFVGHDNNFIYLESFGKKFVVSKKDIIKIKMCENHG